MKKILFFVAILFTTLAFSQEVDFKKGVVYVDGKECLKYDSTDPNNVSFSDLEGNEIFFLKFIHNSRYGSVYNKITFIDQKLTFTSQSYVFSKKLLIKKLLADKTLLECKLDAEKVEKFVIKYDENVER